MRNLFLALLLLYFPTYGYGKIKIEKTIVTSEQQKQTNIKTFILIDFISDEEGVYSLYLPRLQKRLECLETAKEKDLFKIRVMQMHSAYG